MKWTAQSIASGLLWLAAAVALASALLAGAIPIRTPHAVAGFGFTSYIVPGVLLLIVTAAGAYGARRNPGWTVPISVVCLFVGSVLLFVSAFTLGYVCFQTSPAVAASEGCTGLLGSEWLAAASVVCQAVCPALSLLALVAGIVAAVRRKPSPNSEPISERIPW